MTTAKEVLDKLETGDFGALIGLMESEWLDAKEIWMVSSMAHE